MPCKTDKGGRSTCHPRGCTGSSGSRRSQAVRVRDKARALYSRNCANWSNGAKPGPPVSRLVNSPALSLTGEFCTPATGAAVQPTDRQVLEMFHLLLRYWIATWRSRCFEFLVSILSLSAAILAWYAPAALPGSRSSSQPVIGTGACKTAPKVTSARGQHA